MSEWEYIKRLNELKTSHKENAETLAQVYTLADKLRSVTTEGFYGVDRERYRELTMIMALIELNEKDAS